MSNQETMTARESVKRESMKQAIERYIDVSSVAAVLDVVAEICSEKAQHISDNWQDEALAKSWDKAARAVFATATRPSVHLLP
jgi:P2-related tail formation protein